MSLKYEKIRALIRARDFLRDLLDPKKYPKIPKKVRLDAYSCLRHYPCEYDILIREDITGEFKVPPKDIKTKKCKVK